MHQGAQLVGQEHIIPFSDTVIIDFLLDLALKIVVWVALRFCAPYLSSRTWMTSFSDEGRIGCLTFLQAFGKLDGKLRSSPRVSNWNLGKEMDLYIPSMTQYALNVRLSGKWFLGIDVEFVEQLFGG